jgi:hypothetical protein
VDGREAAMRRRQLEYPRLGGGESQGAAHQLPQPVPMRFLPLRRPQLLCDRLIRDRRHGVHPRILSCESAGTGRNAACEI